MDFTERFLYHIWDAQHLKKRLVTRSGKKLKVMFPGRWNTDSGPDFRAAVIRMENTMTRGDVEIDLCGSDWRNHGHNENPVFNEVILQVVFRDRSQDVFRITENGSRIEVLEVEPQLDSNIKKLLDKYKGCCFSPGDQSCPFFEDLDTGQMNLVLARLGRLRLEQKLKRFSAELYFSDFDEILYQGIMESLGYSKNKFQMLLLSKRISYGQLKRFLKAGMTKTDTIAILLGASGLIEKLPSTFPRDLVQKWKMIYSSQEYYKDVVDIDWNLFRIRPVNNPAVRILQFSGLLFESLDKSLLEVLIPVFSFPRDKFIPVKCLKKLTDLFIRNLEHLPGNLWPGESRINIILINIILPMVLLYARRKQFSELENTVLKLYDSCRSLPGNYITAHIKRLIPPLNRADMLKNSLSQQGMIQLYQSFCRHHNCELCLEAKGKLLIQT